MSLKFEWDNRKAKTNLRKHKVSFEEAATVFGDPLSLTIPDLLHSIVENRFITIGRAMTERTLVVIHTDRRNSIRIISARVATKHERRQYEES